MERASQCPSRRIGIDVKRGTRWVHADGRNNRHIILLGLDQGHDQLGIDFFWIADKAQIDHLLNPAFRVLAGAHDFFDREQARILAR